MTKNTGVSSNQTYVTVHGLAHMVGVTPGRIYQLISAEQISAPGVEVNGRQRVYTPEDAVRIWNQIGRDKGMLVPGTRVSSNQSR